MKEFAILVFSLVLNLTYTSAQWIKTNGPNEADVKAIISKNNNIFAGTSGGVYVSRDLGNSWSKTGLSNADVTSFALSDSNLYAGTSYNGVQLSTDDGANWRSTGLAVNYVNSLTFIGYELFAGTTPNGIYKLSSGSSSWKAVNSGLKYPYIFTLSSNGSDLLAGINGYGAYHSTDSGTSWSGTTLAQGATIRAFTFINDKVFAGTDGNGIFISTDHGSTWTWSGLNKARIFALSVSNENIFAGTDNGVLLSTDSGINWKETGLSGNLVLSLAPGKDYIYAGTNNNGGVFRRPLSEMITFVGNRDLPIQFHLEQNYPNPFNPVTTITYSLPMRSYVELKIYDMLGREVTALVSKEQNAGEYKVKFNGSSLPSGIYVYTIQAGQFRESKKLVLVK